MIDNRIKKERFRDDWKGKKSSGEKEGKGNASAKDRAKKGVKSSTKDGMRDGVKGGPKDGTRYSVKGNAKDGLKSNTKNSMKDSMKSGPKDGTRYSVKDNAKDGLRSNTKNSMKDSVKGGTKNSTRYGAKDSVKSSPRAGSKDSTPNSPKDSMRSNSFGQKRHEEENGGRRFQKHSSKCPVFHKCGGCQILDMPYGKQLEQKQKQLEKLLKPYCKVEPIIGMENPYHYRNKVHAVFDHDKKGNPISGVYEANSHRVVPVESCLIEDQKADEIIGSIRGMLKSFKIRTYDEDTGYGLLRHVLIRRGFSTGEIMVVLVTASPIFPSKNNFVKELRRMHPEITTIIQNVNGRDTSMVLGDKENILYGKGYIEDILCGCRFRISSKSFYQVNPVQTEVLYDLAIKAAGLTGNERVIDAYCGIGTIGLVASKHAKEVIGVELNRDAVRDAVENAKINGIKNVRFFCNDAGKFMVNMAENGEHVDVVFMDPPRSGSTEEFIESVAKIKPEKVVYVSCGPETLVRDLGYFRKKGYEAKKVWGVDMFPGTEHVETCVLLSHKNSQASSPSL